MRSAIVGLLASFSSALLAAPVTIENDRIAITVDADRKGAITSLRDKVAGREVLAEGQAPRLFEVEYSPADQPNGPREKYTEQTADAARIERTQDGVVIALTSAKAALQSAQVTLRTVPGSPFIRASMSISFAPGLRLQTIRFPMITHRLLTGDALVSGATKGGIHTPSAWPVGKGVYQAQPGNLAAPFATYYDGQGGFVLAAFDPRGTPKNLSSAG